MKNLKIFSFIIGLFCFITEALAQVERANKLATELLVYILSDSLELAPEHIRDGASVHQSLVRSQRLKTTLEAIRVYTIAKAFPDWNEADSISINDFGQKIRRPDMHRVFTLSFVSEQDAVDAIKSLNSQPSVLFAEKHSRVTFDNDPEYLNGTQWHLRNDNNTNGGDINAEGAWNIFTGSANINIAIIDSGVETNHDEFTGKATGDQQTGDSMHGTAVAGMAAAWANNGQRGRGLDWNARIRSYRISEWGTDPLTGQLTDLYLGDNVASNAIINAVDQGCHIINFSHSFTTFSNVIGLAFAYAYKMNRVSVATMGNTGTLETRFPGAFSNVIAVGSTNNEDERSYYSTTGNHIDVVAPGEDVYTTTINNRGTTTSGTSFSAPLVSGLASLLIGYSNSLSNDDIRQIIRLSADKVGTITYVNGHNNQYGYGRINAGNALEMVRDNTLRQWTTTGGTVFSTSGFDLLQFHGTNGLNGYYRAYRREVRKTVNFPEQFSNIIGVWGRGVGSNNIGWSQANPNYGEGFTEVVSYTANSVTLRTYVYEVWNNIGTQIIGYYPSSAANVTFAYTVLGTLAPVISGSTLICSGSNYSFGATNWQSGYYWDKNPYLTLTANGSSATVSTSITYSVPAWVSIKNSIGEELARFDVWIGPPAVHYFDGPTVAPLYQYVSYEANYFKYSAPNNIQWTLDPSYAGSFFPYGNQASVSFNNPGYYQIESRATNTCGIGAWASISVYAGRGGASSYIATVYPNPARDILYVEIDNPQNIGSAQITYDVRLYDGPGTLLRQTSTHGGIVQFSVAGLPEGVYFVHVYDGVNPTPEVHQVVVER